MTFSTYVKIDLAALKTNVSVALSRVPKNTGLIAMVKADAYGHGAVPVAQCLSACKVSAFGVARMQEGVELREAGIQEPILVMGGLWGEDTAVAKQFAHYDLTPVVHSADVLPTLQQAGIRSFHLKVDTGMSRMGLRLESLPHFCRELAKNPKLTVGGVMTHLAWRQDSQYTQHQVAQFLEAGQLLVKTVGEIPVWHVANSAAILSGEPLALPFPGKIWARPGILLYGIPPYPGWAGEELLRPVMSLVSRIGLLKKVPMGTKVSYNCTFETKRPTRLGVIPIGYADGYSWRLGNAAVALVEGKRVPVVGRVTMDMMMVDVTDCPKAAVGSEVVLLGRQGSEKISADDLAAWGGNLSYEVVCRISKRLSREYLS